MSEKAAAKTAHQTDHIALENVLSDALDILVVIEMATHGMEDLNHGFPEAIRRVAIMAADRIRRAQAEVFGPDYLGVEGAGQ